MSWRMTVSVLNFLVKRMQPKESGSAFKKLEMYQNSIKKMCISYFHFLPVSFISTSLST